MQIVRPPETVSTPIPSGPPPATISVKVMVGIAWSFLLVHAGMLLWAWPSLPERYPMHFNIEGAPDAWVSRSPGTILFSLGMHLFLLAAMSFGIARPDHANIPGRVRLGELAADTQREMMRRIQVALAFIAICASALVAWVGIGQVLVALGTWPRLMSFPIGFIVGAMLATIGWISVDILRAVRASRPH